MKWPVPTVSVKVPKSKTLRGFGGARKGGRLHCGTDILAPLGSSVVAIEAGVVCNVFLFTYPSLDKYHKYEKTYAVVVQHSDGQYALYGEVVNVVVKVGQRVRAGQKLAKVGCIFKNRSKHTMLHFEYHSKLPRSITKWYVGKRPKGLLSSTKYLERIRR